MLRLFGKIRYHWQPEVSWAIIYWSMALLPVFIGLSLLYEKTESPKKVFLLFGIFLFLTILGLRRYFIITDEYLEMVSFNLFKTRKIPIEQIVKVEVTKSSLGLLLANQKTYLVQMRKWPKKYFLDALVVHDKFKGEVELLDHLIKLDYFEHYQDDKKALTS